MDEVTVLMKFTISKNASLFDRNIISCHIFMKIYKKKKKCWIVYRLLLKSEKLC